MKGEKYKPHASWVKISRKSPSKGLGIHPDTYFKVKFSASIFLNKGKSDEKYVYGVVYGDFSFYESQAPLELTELICYMFVT